MIFSDMIGVRINQVNEKFRETMQYSLKIKSLFLINSEADLYLSDSENLIAKI